jgi:ankyrin repeat protein
LNETLSLAQIGYRAMLHGELTKASLNIYCANTFSKSLQEIGDITSLLDVLKITKSLQRLHKWSYSKREYIQLRTRLEDAVHETIKRARQHELDGCWRESEYLWRSIRMYASADRPKEIRNARMEAKSHEARFSNRMIGLSRLVALHEKLGDFPAAEHEQELLVARSARSDADNSPSPLDYEIQTLIQLYRKFQERVASLEVIGLEKDALKEIADLSLLFRVSALECKELYVALLQSNNSMFVMPGDGLSLLHLSASRGSINLITLLLSIGVEVDFPNHSGRSALHLAAREGHECVVKALLEKGAAVNRQDEDDYSPLHFASAEGGFAVAKALLAGGADIKARTSCDGFSPLHSAVTSGRVDVVQLLFGHGSKVGERTATGQTILHLAAKNGHETLVKLFLENGIEKDATDVYGIRPIHDAANVAITQLLLDHGADAHSPDKFGETPLLSASWRSDIKVVKLFLQHKANVDAQDDQGRTPLHRAVLSKKSEIVSTLLENGANVNLQDCAFNTPLHNAARSGEVIIVQLLLRHGARSLSFNAVGYTPLHYATISRMQATSKLLKEQLDVICSTLKSVSR